MPSNIAIGELARRTGTAASALRYYERIGLLPPAERAGGRRHYPASSADRLALIRLCQDAGFTLAEIRRLLAGSLGRGTLSRLAEGKIDELDTRILQAQRAKQLLQHALACPHRDLLTCPNFRAALQARREPSRGPSAPIASETPASEPAAMARGAGSSPGRTGERARAGAARWRS
jgi:DNA-binding transcriptional MerR regulator